MKITQKGLIQIIIGLVMFLIGIIYMEPSDTVKLNITSLNDLFGRITGFLGIVLITIGASDFFDE